jgi:hypothetical protein
MSNKFLNANTVEKIEYDDDTAANLKEYWGWAILGTATSTAKWKIMRRTYGSAALTDYVDEWANSGAYTAKFDDRATSTYL